MSPEFVPALALNAGFYADVIEPIVRRRPHMAALLGRGSDILGYDTARSTDHGWGPRLQIFVDPVDVDDTRAAIESGLPADYRGWPISFAWDEIPSAHHITVAPLGEWLTDYLGFDPRLGVSSRDWLTVPQMRLLGVTRGAVYHDPTGELAAVREQLRFFPTGVALWMLACQWRRIDQDEPFVGRTAEVGDELGSKLAASRMVRELMRLHFLFSGRYWPYAKWFGTAYRELPHSAALVALFETALEASDFVTREDALVAAYEMLARMHNTTGLTEAVEPSVSFFYARPFRVLRSDRFVQACLQRVDDPWLRSLNLVGSIDQFADSTDATERPAAARALRAIYGPS